MVSVHRRIHPSLRDLPTKEEAAQLNADWSEHGNLVRILWQDFEDAVHFCYEFGDVPSGRRNVIRCFGSLIEGLTTAMTAYSTGASHFYRQETNRYLHDKCRERSLPAYNRIYTSYRLVTQFMPRSPIAHLPDARWDDLHQALEIRNRVVHPRSDRALEISDEEFALILETARAFELDFRQFVVWFNEKRHRMARQLPGQNFRPAPKTGRNEKCPCGSERKYKNCCALARDAA